MIQSSGRAAGEGRGEEEAEEVEGEILRVCEVFAETEEGFPSLSTIIQSPLILAAAAEGERAAGGGEGEKAEEAEESTEVAEG